ncbi:MAG: hypothetical protein J6D18_04780 [Erysipelotrichaceae bacterium]|nr:hypothetical protein [Erysipelotrichaceae bacterium]
MSTITFIGAGVMASALTFPSFENGHALRLVGTPLDKDIIDGLRKDRTHLNLKETLYEGIDFYQCGEMEDALQGCDLVLCGVSSFGVEWFAEEALPKIPVGVPVLSVTKGLLDLEDGSLQTFPDYWKSIRPDIDFYAIGGPCIAKELTHHQETWVAYCGQDMEELDRIRKLFETDYYHVTLTDDVTGLEVAVALKNGYALGVSLAVGVVEKEQGEGVAVYNPQAGLFGEAMNEMRQLIALTGGRVESLMYGVGDLYVTVFGGRSRKIGVLLGQGYSRQEAEEKLSGETLESVVIASRVARALRKQAEQGKVDLKDYPLVIHEDEILNQNRQVKIPWEAIAHNK